MQNQLPDWAVEICQLWSFTVDALAHNPRWADQLLDWGIKRALYQNWVGGLAEWAALSKWSRLWTRINARLEKALKRLPEPQPNLPLDTLLSEQSPVPGEITFLTRFLTSIGKDWNGVKQFLRRRQELFEIDVRFGQLGRPGIHSQLMAQGGLPAPMVGAEEIERARTLPPTSGRARVRGDLIARAHASGKGAAFTCDWTRIVNRAEKRYVDLHDPFDPQDQWLPDDQASLRKSIRETLESFF